MSILITGGKIAVSNSWVHPSVILKHAEENISNSHGQYLKRLIGG